MTIKMESYRIYILLCLVIPAGCFRFRKTPNKPLVVYFRNKTNVELRWEWTFGSGEVISPIKIKRHRKNHANTETFLARYYPSSTNVDLTKYTLTVENVRNGYASFVIKDITNQGSGVNVMSENEVYVYKIVVDEQTNAKEYMDEVELKVLKTPVITTYPRNQTVSGGTVTFECAADGKPTPVITWEKIGSSRPLSSGSLLTINNFAASNIGVYRCTAKSTGITQNASATAIVQFSTCGSGCTMEELGIELIDLVYNYEYENSSYNKYKKLKNQIETECLTAYAMKVKSIHKCEVMRFRRGSVVAVVELGWPTNTVDPKQPLLQAISDGTFAGYRVKNEFVPAMLTTAAPKHVITGSTTTTPIKTFVRVKTGISTEVPPESAATCSVAIGVCVTIIVLALLSNSVLGFLLWNKSSQLKEFTKNRAQLAMASNDHPVIAANYSNKAVIINRQPEVPTAPIYHDVFNVNHSTADHSNQLYQTLDTNSQQPAQTYQILDVAKKNALTPVETSVPGNYQALQDTLPAAKLNRVV